MKTVKNKIFVVLMASVLALPAMAAFGDQEQPNAVFQSTSTLSPSGSAYSSNPALDENGTASEPSNSPRRIGTPPPPTIDKNDTGNTPVGDAALPLLVFAAAAAATVAIRNRRRQMAE